MLLLNSNSASDHLPPERRLVSSNTAPQPMPDASVVNVLEGVPLDIGAPLCTIFLAHQCKSCQAKSDYLVEASKLPLLFFKASDFSISSCLVNNTPKGTATEYDTIIPMISANCLMQRDCCLQMQVYFSKNFWILLSVRVIVMDRESRTKPRNTTF